MSSVVDRMRLRAHVEQQVLEEVEEVEEVRTSMSCGPWTPCGRPCRTDSHVWGVGINLVHAHAQIRARAGVTDENKQRRDQGELSLFPLPSLLRLCPSPPCSDHLPRARLFLAVRRESPGRSVSPPMSLPRIQLLSAHPCLSLSSASTEFAGAADALTVIHIPPLSTVLPTRPPRRPTCLPLRPRTSTLQSRLFLPPHGHPLALLYPLID